MRTQADIDYRKQQLGMTGFSTKAAFGEKFQASSLFKTNEDHPRHAYFGCDSGRFGCDKIERPGVPLECLVEAPKIIRNDEVTGRFKDNLLTVAEFFKTVLSEGPGAPCAEHLKGSFINIDNGSDSRQMCIEMGSYFVPGVMEIGALKYAAAKAGSTYQVPWDVLEALSQQSKDMGLSVDHKGGSIYMACFEIENQDQAIRALTYHIECPDTDANKKCYIKCLELLETNMEKELISVLTYIGLTSPPLYTRHCGHPKNHNWGCHWEDGIVGALMRLTDLKVIKGKMVVFPIAHVQAPNKFRKQILYALEGFAGAVFSINSKYSAASGNSINVIPLGGLAPRKKTNSSI